MICAAMGENSRRRVRRIAAASLVVLAVPAMLRASGFGPPAKAAIARTVKLYGLGAGVQVNYGTGTLISADGKILTVLSLLIDAHRVRAVTATGHTFEAKILARDKQRQLAMLQLVPWAVDDSTVPDYADDGGYLSEAHAEVGPFPFFDVETGRALTAADSRSNSEQAGENVTLHADDVAESLRPGDWVVAAGNAFKVAVGAEPVSITHGIFSTRTRLDARRRVKDYPYRGDVLIIDAITSNPGAPGGAVVDLDGRLVGLIGRVVVSNRTHTHVNHAVPRDVLAEFVQESQHRAGGDAMASGIGDEASLHSSDLIPSRAKDGPTPVDVGIRLSRVGYRQVLPFVDRVRRGSPAAAAGIRVDDLILSIDGRTVSDVKDYDTQCSYLRAGEGFDVVVRRGRRILSLRVETESP